MTSDELQKLESGKSVIRNKVTGESGVFRSFGGAVLMMTDGRTFPFPKAEDWVRDEPTPKNATKS